MLDAARQPSPEPPGMPALGSIARFDDADAFASSVHNCRLAYFVKVRGEFQARVALSRIDDLHLALVTEALPRRATLSFPPDRVFFRFVAAQDRPKWRGGIEDRPGTLQIGPGMPGVEDVTQGPTISRSLSLPIATVLAQAEVMFDEPPLFLSGRSMLICPPADLTAKLTAMHRDMIRMTASASGTSFPGHRVAAMYAAIWNLLTEILATGTTDRSSRQVRRGQATMQTLVDYIRANEDRPITLTELCAVVGCSAKSLETLFLRHVGETPNRYLRRWRLWRAHEALSTADPATTTVSQIAVACGFWELGRFAGRYRQLFGESPSQTLVGAARSRADLSRRPATKSA